MPKKQTRESIEAELNASEFERMSVKFEILIRDLDNLEMRLRELEKRRGIPDFCRTKSLQIGRASCRERVWLLV